MNSLMKESVDQHNSKDNWSDSSLFKEATVYLVKFPSGYYAAKQPEFHYTFTLDPLHAHFYKSIKLANRRGRDGLKFETQEECRIEEYKVVTTLMLVKEFLN